MQRKRVLIADHHEEDAQILRKVLVGVGYEVRLASNGEQALELCEAFEPQLVYAEARLPIVDGPHLVHEIRARFKNPPVLLILAADSDRVEEHVHYMSLDIDDFFVKPFDLEEFLAHLEVLFREVSVLEAGPKPERKGFSGSLAEMNLVDLLQTLEVGEKTGVLRISRDGREGRIYFRDGEVIDAEVDDLQSLEALHRLFTWVEGNFLVELRPIDRNRTIEGPNKKLWTDGMSRLDRWQTLRSQLPPLHHVAVRNESVDPAGLPYDHQALWALLEAPRKLIDLVYDSELEDLTALQRVVELFKHGAVTILPPDEVSGNGNLETGVIKPEPNGEQPSGRIRDLFASLFRTQEEDNRRRAIGFSGTDRRTLTDRRTQSRRSEELKRERNRIYLSRSELLVIRERLLQG